MRQMIYTPPFRPISAAWGISGTVPQVGRCGGGFPGWSQEATERSFEGNVELLCSNNKPLFKKTQGEEPQCMQDSSSGKWVIERDPQISRLLDHQPTFHACFLSITPAPDPLGVRGTTNYLSLPFPSLFLPLSLCISWSVCPSLSLAVPLNLSFAFLLSVSPQSVLRPTTSPLYPTILPILSPTIAPHFSPHSTPFTDPPGHYT